MIPPILVTAFLLGISVQSFTSGPGHYGDNGLRIRVDVKLVRVNDNEYSLRISDDYRTEYHFKRKKESSSVWIAASDNDWHKKETSIKVDLYEDSGMDASIIIEKETGGYRISGTLGDGRVIAPMEDETVDLHPDCAECLPVVPHEVRGPSDDEDCEFRGSSDYEQVEAQYPRARRGKSVRDMPAKVQPEILILVDYFLFEKLKFDKKRTEKYVMSFFNAVNLRFKSVDSPRIELAIAGIIIAETKSALPYIAENIIKSDMIDAASTLHDMGKYFYKERSDLPIYDLVVTMTGLDMTRMKKGKRIRATSGYAYVGGACVRNTYLKKISSVALVEDSGGYSGVVVTAHEIGHLLGAVHDGDPSPSYLRGPGAKACPWSAGYIMSDLRHTARGQTWSGCSVKQIRHFLRTSTAGCLYNSPRGQSDLSLPGERSLPGRSISLDAQCRQDRGTRACYHDHRVCAQLFCYTDNYRGCYAYRPAVEGSSCGTNKMCLNGKCVKITSSFRDSYNYVTEDQIRGAVVVTTVTTSAATTTTTAVTTSTTKITTTTTAITIKSVTVPSVSAEPETTRENIQDDDSQETKKNNLNKKSKKKSFITRMPKHHEEKDALDRGISSDCQDSFKVLGSLTCPQLFQRYAFHYCKNNRVIKKKCCISYHKFCRAPALPR